MFGRPKDIEGECNAHLYLGDDWGDNVCTIRCQLPKGHRGLHKERGRLLENPFTITWYKDERNENVDG